MALSIATLTSMEKPKPMKQMKEAAMADCPTPMYEKYPYGLKICLENDELKKLGIDVVQCKVDDTGMLIAKFEIVNATKTEHRDYETGEPKENNRLELQITDLAVEKAVSENPGKKTLGDAKGLRY